MIKDNLHQPERARDPKATCDAEPRSELGSKPAAVEQRREGGKCNPRHHHHDHHNHDHHDDDQASASRRPRPDSAPLESPRLSREVLAKLGNRQTKVGKPPKHKKIQNRKTKVVGHSGSGKLCAACEKPLTDDGFFAMGTLFHQACFRYRRAYLFSSPHMERKIWRS